MGMCGSSRGAADVVDLDGGTDGRASNCQVRVPKVTRVTTNKVIINNACDDHNS